MKLNALIIKHFKGLRDFPLEPDCKNLDIYGDNQVGKTTIFDALCWLLYEYDSQGNAKFDIRPTTYETEEATMVEGVFLHNDQTIVLRKTYQDIYWAKGEKKGQLKAHQIDRYFGVDTDQPNYYDKKQDYISAVSKALTTEETLKRLSDPLYMQDPDRMPWKEIRKLVLQMAGVDDTEINELTMKQETLKKNISDLEAQRKGIPDEIKGAQKILPEVTPIDPADYECAKAELQSLQEKRAGMTTDTVISNLQRQLADKDTELQQVKNQQRKKIDDQLETLKEGLAGIQKYIEEIEKGISHKRRASGEIIAEQQAIMVKHTALNEEYKTLYESEFKEAGQCPILNRSCEYLHEDASNKFHLHKATRLEEIRNEDDGLKARHKELGDEGEALNKEINELNLKLPPLKEQEQDLKEKIEKLALTVRDIESLPEYVAILEKKGEIEGKLKAGLQAIDTSEIDGQIKDLETQISQAEEVKAMVKQRAEGLKTIDEMKAREKDISKQIGESSGELMTIDKAIEDLLKSQREAINSMFEYMNIRTFKWNLNGSLEQCCDFVARDGVAQKGFSHSQKVRAGMDFIRVYAKHVGFNCPIVIDDADLTTYWPDMGDIQLIRLIVSKPDKQLRVEQVKEQGVLV